MSFGTRSLPPLGAPPARSLLRSPRALASALTVLLGVCAATRLLLFAADAGWYQALDGARDADPSGRLFAVATSLSLLAMVPTAVVFVVWFHRVRVNAGVFAPELFRRGPGWAIGIWFIPFVGCTFLAYGIATGVWAASAPKSPRAAAPVSAAPVTAWSVSFGAAMLASLVSSRMGAAAEAPAGLRAAALVAMASDLLFVVAAGFAVVFVRKVSTMQARA
ncbi:DUF4328 domain-containing protein [Streptomyces sp. NBC_01343]|uniref:DUF4328 domain-containing protein n=1 Tax=Streptomyces sp. NBC_01343 TaxID=2903832 RepID=UPI002E0FA319|nr:DUF4328 domain-containing protein [Streptomyces sp. NBC_01343]